MRAARVAIGVTLIAVGTASAIRAARAVMGDGARAQAALLATETLRAQEQAAQQSRAEQAVTRAAHITTLIAALRAPVDATTLVDLFDHEDWWRPYRAEFPAVRVVDATHVLGASGPDLGERVRARRRRRPQASAGLGGDHRRRQDLRRRGDRNPRAGEPRRGPGDRAPVHATAAGRRPAAASNAAGHPGTWAPAIALAVCGIGLIVSVGHACPRGARRGAARAHVAVRRAPRPRAPALGSTRITDGNAVRIPSPQSPIPKLSSRLARPAAAAEQRDLRPLPAARSAWRGRDVRAVRRRGDRRRGVHAPLRAQAAPARAGP